MQKKKRYAAVLPVIYWLPIWESANVWLSRKSEIAEEENAKYKKEPKGQDQEEKTKSGCLSFLAMSGQVDKVSRL